MNPCEEYGTEANLIRVTNDVIMPLCRNYLDREKRRRRRFGEPTKGDFFKHNIPCEGDRCRMLPVPGQYINSRRCRCVSDYKRWMYPSRAHCKKRDSDGACQTMPSGAYSTAKTSWAVPGAAQKIWGMVLALNVNQRAPEPAMMYF
jgi:hypothetical protein